MEYFKGRKDAIPPTTKSILDKKDTMLRNKGTGQVKV
jgi:hypothetical protein